MELTSVFLKGVGEGTDIVDKEMYSFVDKGGDQLTLRPEFTAGVMRAYLEEGMRSRPQPVKLASIGPIFRRDRPGAGRYRQFHQINAEIIGADDAAADAELLVFAASFGAALGLGALKILVNSTGCPACKPPYLAKLVGFLRERREKLSALDRDRVERNPLRVLDSKEPETQAVVREVPLLAADLCEACRTHFAEVRALLAKASIEVEESPLLVRGLDYYTRTVFEIVSPAAPDVGTLLGGGRYDGLAEMLDGPPTPGVGFGGGIERMILALKALEKVPRTARAPGVFVAYIGAGAKRVAFGLAEELRRAGVDAVFGLGNKGLKAQMKLADKSGAGLAVIVGEGELAEGKVQLRTMGESRQELVPLEGLVAVLAARVAPTQP
jgi:histidyl-tRNA synthetase